MNRAVGVMPGDQQDAASHGPPKPPFAFRLGVTGHRSASLGASAATVETRIRQVVEEVGRAAHRQCDENRHWFADQRPCLTLVSPLADGADQIAAMAGLERGFSLQVIMPFSREVSRAEVDARSRSDFDRLIDAAGGILELPGDPQRPLDAYVMAGRATVAHSDLLIAVWDGEVPRGRGGTGEIVELAMGRGTPLVHIPIASDQPITLLWSAYDPAVVTVHSGDVDRRPYNAANLDALLALLVAPPQDSRERDYLATFIAERQHRYRARIEYPLLLATAGVGRFDAKDFREERSSVLREQEWRRYTEACLKPHGFTMAIDLLGTTHGWADQLATHFAQNYRSGHVLNFTLAAMAVLVGLSGFLFPKAQLGLAAFEFLLALLIIVNTRVGVTRQWHRRWLDYRQLAERLRPLRSLKLLGIAAPDPPGSVTNPVARRWIEWYSSAIWRAVGCPAGTAKADMAGPIARAIAEQELDPQVAYHQSHSKQIQLLDHRLERVSIGIFWVTLAASAATIAALALAPHWFERWQDWLTLISAGLPAVGTAVFGIRFQGDFGGSALRSEATAASLAVLARELRTDGIELPRAADLGEQAARAMFADLSEWRLVHEQHDLTISG
ncbi:hypothetical protein [Sphingomonas xanthus]|uniref:SMODS and SLOG-associating 2TM effector domain-containing protein n=1 Tax=Sphingomonas xanthus TaxID=2594473 RepID=A0A516IRU3_9SPHN|nr:hypothetical protein [Sphingomonas xanthus]QDP19633.1 hypothetical protein FMM02_06450 [Sphingomonas xanthus]